MKEPAWVLQDTVLAVHQMLLAQHGGLSGIRDEALLISSLARQQQRFNYATNVSLFELAASYSYGLAKNHPFMDGNKRIALTIGAIFLEINNHSLDAPEAEAAIVFEKVAAGNLDEKGLGTWFQDCSLCT